MTLKNPIPEYLEYSGKHVVICLGTHLQATAKSVKVNIPFAHKIIKIRSQVTVALSATASVLTIKDDGGTAFTGGVCTIAASAAVGDLDVSTDITAGTQTQAKDKVVEVALDGGPTTGEVVIWLELEHSDP